MNTYKHCTELTAKSDFAFRVGGKGRAITVRTGQAFWVTNTQVDQQTRGIVLVDRKGKGSISAGYAFTPEQIETLFTQTL
jgi:hypothetical protein